jgi:UDP-N-acetylmuramate--alanine ligase
MMSAVSYDLAGEIWARTDLRTLARQGSVHFMGIAGAGMSALAELLLRSGGSVTGCDTNPGPVTDALIGLGARVLAGHDPAHVHDAVAVVATAAVPVDHPELGAARARGIPVFKRAHALAAVVNRGRLIAIAGTHGKTTTTAMTAAILAEAALDPTAFVGGQVAAWGRGLRYGSDALFVVEADEYDRSFLALTPQTVVITSVEADHLDVFGTLAELEEAFHSFAGRVPPAGTVAACIDDPGARRILARRPGGLGYGTSDSATLRAVDVQLTGRTSRFLVREGAAVLGEITVNAPAIHNVRNALGALAAARSAGAGFDTARLALARFSGVARRMQELGTEAGITVVDDYAHHPTEIAATIAACRTVYAGRTIVAVFQPHLYTRTRDFVLDFGASLAAADAVWVTDIYPAREAPIEGVSGELVARAAERAVGRTGAAVRYIPGLDELVEELARELRPGDVCLAMGAGDIDQAARALIERLRRRATR